MTKSDISIDTAGPPKKLIFKKGMVGIESVARKVRCAAVALKKLEAAAFNSADAMKDMKAAIKAIKKSNDDKNQQLY